MLHARRALRCSRLTPPLVLVLLLQRGRSPKSRRQILLGRFGGAFGIIGTGIVRGLGCGSGAPTVICNSRYKQRLDALTAELGHPEKLVAYQGSMLADGARRRWRM